MNANQKPACLVPILGLLAAALPCQAVTIWMQDGGAEKQSVSNTVSDTAAGYRTSQLYTHVAGGGAGDHLPSQPFNVGDRFTATFTVTVGSASPNPIAWLGNASIAFAVNDDVTDHAVGMTFDLTGTERVRVGFDKSAPGAGNFGTLSDTAGSWVNGTVASEQFLALSDTADLVFTVSKTASDAAGDELNLSLQWGTTATLATRTIGTSEGVRINQLDEFLFRMNVLDGTGGAASAGIDVTDFELNLIPEPGAGMLLLLGAGLGALRRRRC